MDRGKTIGCGLFITAVSVVSIMALGGGLGGLLFPLGPLLIVIGFCLKSGARPRAEYRHARRVPRPGQRR